MNIYMDMLYVCIKNSMKLNNLQICKLNNSLEVKHDRSP